MGTSAEVRRPGGALLQAPPHPGVERWRSIFTRSADVAALLAILSLFSSLCFQQLGEPGLYEDEAWSATQAVRLVAGRPQIDPAPYHQVTLFGHAVPFMRNGYVGPVKTYLLVAAFSLFGISVSVLRVTTGLVGLLAAIVLYACLRREFGRVAALSSAVLLATDASYILAVRDDWGPVAIGMLARVVSLALLFAWYRARTRIWLLFAALLTLGLGVLHKVDLLGFVAAVLIGGAVVFGSRLHLQRRELVAGGLGFLTGVWPLLLYNVLTRGGTVWEGAGLAQSSLGIADPLSGQGAWLLIQRLPHAFVQRMQTLDVLLDGSSVADWLTGVPVERLAPLGASRLPLATTIAMVLLLALLATGRIADRTRHLAFLLVTFALTFVLIVITPIASGPHHLLGVYPFPHIVVGIALGALWRGWHVRPRLLTWCLRVLAGAAVPILVLPSLVLMHTFYAQLQARGGYWYWSDTIYDLYDALRGPYQGRTVELLDWGFEQPLTVLGRDELPIETPFWIMFRRAVPDQEMTSWLEFLLTRPNHVWVMRADVFEFDRAVHERFRAAVVAHPGLTVREQRFFQRDGEYAFSVFEFGTAVDSVHTEALTSLRGETDDGARRVGS